MMMMMAEDPEPLTAVVITEEIPTAAALQAQPPSKSYLRRLGDYLNRRRLRSESQEEVDQQQQKEDEKDGELSNVIFSDSQETEKKKPGLARRKGTHGHFVMATNKNLQDSTSDISEVEIHEIVNVAEDEDLEDDEEEEEEEEDEGIDNVMGAKAPKASNGYLLPRVFLNKEG